MIAELLFYLGLIVSLGIGAIYFRDIGDVVQVVLKVKRTNMIRFIRNEYLFVGIGLGAVAVMIIGRLMGGGMSWLFWLALLLNIVLYGFPYVWVHLGLRNQQGKAQYFSVDKALEYVTPISPVVVIENNGTARAHPDSQILRPHLAGNDKGLDGENVIMTYCAVANLGLGYKPEIEGKLLDLEVLAQHGNNLILRDGATGEPIQHIYGFRERDKDTGAEGAACPLRPALAMQPWPTFRMTMRGFQKAYPEGEVFINVPPSNPLLKALDFATSIAFGWGIGRQHAEAAPVMDNMSRFDDRLHNKTHVWGVNIGSDATCWTDDFVKLHAGPINATVGGRDLVVAYHPKYESIGVWYNDSGQPVSEIDFFGQSDQGQLQRVEMLKPGLFWLVWAEFFPGTDINREGMAASEQPAEISA